MENIYSDNLLQQNMRIKNMKDSFIRHPNLYPINDPNIIPNDQINKIISASNKINKSKKPDLNNHEPMVKEQKQPKVAKVKEPKPPKEVKVKEDKPKKKAIPSTIKKLVWNTNIGEDIGKAKCVCCKSTDITQMSFNCGHVISEHNGGETKVSNLKPICQNCNSSMGTKNMNDFMLTLL